MTSIHTAHPTTIEAGRAWDRLVRAGWLFGAGSAVHIVDHLRRGQGSVTELLYYAGNSSLVLQVVIVTLVATRHRAAPVIAVAGGLPLALGFAAAHWLPTWSALSDSFVSNPTRGFSYLASALEIGGAITVAWCGWQVRRTT